MKHHLQKCWIVLLCVGALAGCNFVMGSDPTPQPTPVSSPTPLAVEQLGVHEVVGTVYKPANTYSEKFNRTFVLYDLTGFLNQDALWKMPPQNMVVAHVQVSAGKAQYVLDLPVNPQSKFHDLDQNDKEDTGVQLFTYLLAENFLETDYVEKTEQKYGWPYADIALTFNPQDTTQIVEGWLLVWAGDNQQMFPVDVGEDGVLFSDDDLVEPLLQGYTSIYFNHGKLIWDRSPSVAVAIGAPLDQRLFDLSHKDALTAYDEALVLLEQYYPGWNDEKTAPDKAYLQKELREKMQQAVDQEDALAIRQVYGELLTHLNNAGIELLGPEPTLELLKQTYPADFGFLIDTMQDGQVRVTEMRESSPTYDTNLNYGDILLEVDGMPVDDAIAAQTFTFLPATDPVTTRKLQELFLLRKPEGEKLRIKVRNIKGEEETFTLTSTLDTSLMEYKLPEWFSEFRADPLPIEVEQYSDHGVIHVYDMDRDPELTVEMFERALMTFEERNIQNVLVDLQNASGTRFLHLAGFFTNMSIDLGTYQCPGAYAQPLKLDPAANYYSFYNVSAVIGNGCRGACELEALAFSKLFRYSSATAGSPTYGAIAAGELAQINFPGDVNLNFPLCQIDSIRKSDPADNDQIIPQIDLPGSYYRDTIGNDYVVDQAYYSLMKNHFLEDKSEPMQPLSISEIYYYVESAYSINYMMEEDEALMFRMHDVPSYDLHAVRNVIDNPGVFEFQYCEDNYEHMQQIQRSARVSFFLDDTEFDLYHIINWYYQSDDYQHCNFWIMGVKDFPVGHHILKMHMDVTEPVLIEGVYWETGQYDFNYHLYIYDYPGEE